ncbi:hypothetical protein BGZ96_012790 [Linnemannia gamsii]|uniref:Uncharacterized protein n=1 Tax=Linnemannia gamsii TaxID=64522 RepID=A0ABQ7JQ93_9FUNG|nr:hypothetical protein BGZ96_012790 [Linnemannia gamsii]
MIQFTTTVESLLNQFTDYQTIQAEIFQRQLIATLTNSNTTIAISPAKDDAMFAILDTPPLTSMDPSSDDIQDDFATSHAARLTNVDVSETNPRRGQLPFVSSVDIHPTNRNSTDTGMDKYGGIDMDTTPRYNSATIRHGSVSTMVDTMTINGTKYTKFSISSRSSNDIKSKSSGSYNYASTSGSKEHPSSQKRRNSSSSTSTSSHSYRDHYSPQPSTSHSSFSYRDHHSPPSTSASSRSYRDHSSTQPTRDREAASSYPSASPTQTALDKIMPATRKYNADSQLTLPDFLKRLKETFDRHPEVFKVDSNRVQYALRSMSKHVLRYFEPFLNKSLPDNRKCLEKYPVFVKILNEKFGKYASTKAKLTAKTLLAGVKQSGSMQNYIAIIQHLATIDRWSEKTILNAFKKGISPEVLSLIGGVDQIQSLSKLQVTAVKAYAVYRNLPKVQKQHKLAKSSSSAYPVHIIPDPNLSFDQE